MTEYVVEKGASALPSGASASDDLFAVSGGRVILKRLIGLTSTSITAAGNHQLQVDVGTPVPVLGSFSLNGLGAGIGITSSGFSHLPSGVLDQVAKDGDVIQVESSDSASGSASWTLVYEPLDPGAKVSAA